MSDTVRTKQELDRALERKLPEIIVKGELADKLDKAWKLKTASQLTITLLAGSIAAAPVTGGISLAAAGPLAALTGLEISLIMAVMFLGLSTVLVAVKDYKILAYNPKDGETEASLVMSRNTQP